MAAVNGGLLTIDEVLRALQPDARGIRLAGSARSTARACRACASRASSTTATSTSASSSTDPGPRLAARALARRYPPPDALRSGRAGNASAHAPLGRRAHTRCGQTGGPVMGWIIAIIVGGVAGWLASIVMRRDASMGILMEHRRRHHRRAARRRDRQCHRVPDRRRRLDHVPRHGVRRRRRVTVSATRSRSPTPAPPPTRPPRSRIRWPACSTTPPTTATPRPTVRHGGLAGSTLTWTGRWPSGPAATITYSVTVKQAVGGDNLLRNHGRPRPAGQQLSGRRHRTPGAPRQCRWPGCVLAAVLHRDLDHPGVAWST